MAKLVSKTSFANATITMEGEDFYIEEFKTAKDVVTSLGKWNLSQQLKGLLNVEDVSLSFDVKSELDSEEE